MRIIHPLWPVLLGLAFFMSACGPSQVPLVQLNGPTMGSTYHLTLVSPAQGLPADAQAQIDLLLQRMDKAFSTYRNDSEIARFNHSQDTHPQTVSEDVVTVAKAALQLGKDSEGALDVTLGPLLRLWGFGGHDKPAALPSDAAIAAAKAQTGLAKLVVAETTLTKTDPTLEIDFSAVVAGYAADQLALLVESWGVTDYLLEVTGEMRVKGRHPAGRPWRIAVEKPVAGSERAVERVVELHDIGVATSGDYRNFYVVDGKRYSHTLDPLTGRPIEHLMVSVTVLHPSAMVADGWATALMAMGPERGREMATRHELAVLMILKEGEVFTEWASPAMQPYLTAAGAEPAKE